MSRSWWFGHGQVLQRGGVVGQTSEKIARLSADVREIAARQNLAVRLHRDGKDSTSSRSDRTNQPSRSWHRAGRCGCASVHRCSLKSPPAKILPSACTAIETTSSFAFGSNESATPVVASSRAMRLRVCPPMLVKSPPAKTLPSACTAIEKTLVATARVRVERIRQAGRGIEPGDVVARLSADAR